MYMYSDDMSDTFCYFARNSMTDLVERQDSNLFSDTVLSSSYEPVVFLHGQESASCAYLLAGGEKSEAVRSNLRGTVTSCRIAMKC